MINPEKILSFYAADTPQIKGKGSAIAIIERQSNRNCIKERTLRAIALIPKFDRFSTPKMIPFQTQNDRLSK